MTSSSVFSNSRGDYVPPGTTLGRASSMFSIFRTPIGPGFTSPDLEALFANTRRSKLAHEALTRARLAEAEDDNLLLQSAAPSDIKALFSAPTNPTQERLQKIVNRDVLAKERGVGLLPTWDTLQKYERGILSNLNLAENINDARFSRDLRTEQLEQQRMRDMASLFNQERQREHARRQLEAQERYREAQIQNADANRQQRQQQFGITQAQRDFQTMMALERMLQERANEEARQGAQLYDDVARAAQKGALPTSDIQALFRQSLDPAMLGLVEGYANRFAQDDERAIREENALRQQFADEYDRQIQKEIEASQPNFFSKMFGAKPNTSRVDSIVLQMLRNSDAAGRIQYDAENQTVRPRLIPNPYGAEDEAEDEPLSDDLGLGIVPANMGAIGAGRLFDQRPAPPPPRAPAMRFPNGATIRNRKTGEIFRVKNGQLIPVG